MIVEKIDTGLDGGTIYIFTNEGIFCFDYRCYTNTEGLLYEGYPDDGKVAEHKLPEILPFLDFYLIKKILKSRENFYHTRKVWLLFYPEFLLVFANGSDEHYSFFKQPIKHSEFVNWIEGMHHTFGTPLK